MIEMNMRLRSENTKAKGNIAELKVATRLMEMGLQVYFPFGENSEADLIVELNGLKRVQTKTVKVVNGCCQIPLTSVCLVKGKYVKRRYQRLDYIACVSDRGRIYLVPFEDVKDCKTTVSLRVDPPKKNTARTGTPLRMADKYDITEMG